MLDTHCFDGVGTERTCCPHNGDECEEVAVVHVLDQEFDSGRTWPMCFRHAFVYALAHDAEAQTLALGYAISRGLGAPAHQVTT